MINTLAQSSAIEGDSIFSVVLGVFSRGDALAHPDTVVNSLANMSIVWAVIFLVAGLVTLLNGYKFYRPVVITLALAIGAFAGYWMGQQINAPEIVAGCLALLLAVCAWPLMKYAVAAMGGIVGAFLGANIWSATANLMHEGSKASEAVENYWIGALIGLVVCGMLAFIVFKLSIELFTSVSGATIAVLGATALLLRVEIWKGPITDGISAHAVVLPLLVLVPAVIGLILQENTKAAAAD